MVTFTGLEPWTDNFPRIDFQTPHGLVDLHNSAALEEIRFSVATSALVLRFRWAENWREVDTAGSRVELEFGGVATLRIIQADNFDVRAADTLEGVTQVVNGERSGFTVDIGDLSCSFSAQSVELRVY